MLVFVEAKVVQDPALAAYSNFKDMRQKVATFRDGTCICDTGRHLGPTAVTLGYLMLYMYIYL